MNKIYLSAKKYREFQNNMGEYLTIGRASCEYCGMPYQKDEHYPETCWHCGAVLRGYLTLFGIDPVTGERFELVCTG